MLEDMVYTEGQILDKVEALGITDNTYIIFMAENGSLESVTQIPSFGATLQQQKLPFT